MKMSLAEGKLLSHKLEKIESKAKPWLALQRTMNRQDSSVCLFCHHFSHDFSVVQVTITIPIFRLHEPNAKVSTTLGRIPFRQTHSLSWYPSHCLFQIALAYWSWCIVPVKNFILPRRGGCLSLSNTWGRVFCRLDTCIWSPVPLGGHKNGIWMKKIEGITFKVALSIGRSVCSSQMVIWQSFLSLYFRLYPVGILGSPLKHRDVSSEPLQVFTCVVIYCFFSYLWLHE